MEAKPGSLFDHAGHDTSLFDHHRLVLRALVGEEELPAIEKTFATLQKASTKRLKTSDLDLAYNLFLLDDLITVARTEVIEVVKTYALSVEDLEMSQVTLIGPSKTGQVFLKCFKPR